MNVRAIYEGSNGAATQALYDRLQTFGPAGIVALNLFRASKCSARAKVYRRGCHKRDAYDRKQWSLSNLCTVLQIHADALGIVWGWKEDPAQAFHRWVLYVVLPVHGQVSFHSATAIGSQRFAGEWDGSRESHERILRHTAALFASVESEVAG